VVWKGLWEIAGVGWGGVSYSDLIYRRFDGHIEISPCTT
jgi:hypothetical protein